MERICRDIDVFGKYKNGKMKKPVFSRGFRFFSKNAQIFGRKFLGDFWEVFGNLLGVNRANKWKEVALDDKQKV